MFSLEAILITQSKFVMVYIVYIIKGSSLQKRVNLSKKSFMRSRLLIRYLRKLFLASLMLLQSKLERLSQPSIPVVEFGKSLLME